LIAGRYVVNHFLGLISGAHSHEIFLLAILLIVVGASILAHGFGFSYSLGAFMAGMVIAETQYKYQVEADFAPFRDLLLGVFFVSVGMQIDPVIVINKFALVLMITAGIMTIKMLIIFSILRISHWTGTAVRSAIALSQVGEFSFVIFEEGRSAGLIDSSFSQIMVISVTISMFITPFILMYMDIFIRLFRKKGIEEKILVSESVDKMNNHILVLGYGYYGQKVVEHLENLGVPYVAVEFQKQLVDLARAKGHNIIIGNAAQKSILKKCGVLECISVIVAIDDEKIATLICQRIYSISMAINVVVKSSHQKAFTMLRNNEATHIVDEHEELSKLLVDYAISCNLKTPV
jgi:CPA2 family monovalent cation:H+ antiporter-2